jgi:hypothetical protein
MPDLVEDWIHYSDDKRTSRGYWLSERDLTVGSLMPGVDVLQFDSLELAVSRYVLLELDYWASAADSDNPNGEVED